MTTQPREHPDADLLADLAADVLPEELARRVESHVVGCDRCAGLLAEAEGIRGLLRRDTPPAMPEDVADRIGAAIAGLRLGPAAGDRAGLDEDADADARWAAAAARGAVGAARGRRSVDEGTLGADAASGRTLRRKVERGRAASVTRLRRAAGAPARPRRQAIEEQRSAERAGRVGRVLLAAAAVVVFVAAGGLAVRLLGEAGVTPTAASNGDSGSGGGAEDSAASAPGPPTGLSRSSGGQRSGLADGEAPVLATGTDYTAAGLEAQARLLIGSAGLDLYAAGGDAKATASGKPAPSPEVGPQQAAKPPPGNQALRTPAALRACLQALNATDQQVVAVDLARYQGRDSAVIVLRASGGAYDVWVVARDCRPGADGTLKYVPMTP